MYLHENKKKSKIFWVVNLGPRYFRFMKKTRAQKSRATAVSQSRVRFSAQAPRNKLKEWRRGHHIFENFFLFFKS